MRRSADMYMDTAEAVRDLLLNLRLSRPLGCDQARPRLRCWFGVTIQFLHSLTLVTYLSPI